MKKELDYTKFPSEYELCFNNDCQLRDRCLHHQAYLLQPKKRLGGPAVYPEAWQDGQCRRFSEEKLVRKAWGFSSIYKNVAPHRQTEARRSVMKYFSSGCGPYYRYHHGEHKLSPSQQQDIMAILARFGSTEGLAFDHYETDFDFA